MYITTLRFYYSNILYGKLKIKCFFFGSSDYEARFLLITNIYTDYMYILTYDVDKQTMIYLVDAGIKL